MRTTVLPQRAELHLPETWPAPFHPAALGQIDHPTPFLICDLDTVRARYAALIRALPGVRCFYALKCNSSPEVITALMQVGASFEVASAGELELLRGLGVDPRDVLYSNTVKPPSHIATAHRRGLWRFAFDSIGELRKLATHAPGSSVYVRVRVDDSTSTFPLSRKFGAELGEATELLRQAKGLGLEPYGVTFHVGSQCASTSAWRQALATVARLLDDLADDGIQLEMLDMGGGIPARYGDPVPGISDVGSTVTAALHELLPYIPRHLAVEPGRYLVAESGVLAAGVLGTEVRAGENWLYTDVGAYNGLMETQQTVNQWRYPLWTSRPDHVTAPQIPYTVTGPSCDSSDTMFFGVPLPASLEVDDRLYIGSTGAYTLSYASSFNGFPPPATLFVGTT